MNSKFKVYAQTRATRQLAGDVAVAINVDWETMEGYEEKEKWEEIEKLLNDIECKLERMNL